MKVGSKEPSIYYVRMGEGVSKPFQCQGFKSGMSYLHLISVVAEVTVSREVDAVPYAAHVRRAHLCRPEKTAAG